MAIIGRGAALLGFNHLNRTKNEWPLVFEYPSAIYRTVRAVMELTSGLRRLRWLRSRIYLATPASEANGRLSKFVWYGNDFAGEPRLRRMISRRASYHGSTIAGSALGGSNKRACELRHSSVGIV